MVIGMASPQLEDGYVQIANEIWEQLARIRIPGESMQVLLVIIRKTYGFHKKEDWISLSQFVESTGINKQNISRAISKLSSMNLINVIKKDNDYHARYCFNKNYDTWKPLSKKIKTFIKKDKEPLSKKITTKYNSTKDNITKNIMGKNHRFVPPKPDEVTLFAQSIGYDLDGEYFCNWYGAKNWMIGKNKMSNWKLAVHTWKNKDKQNNIDKNRAPNF